MSTHRAASKALASFKVDNIKSNALLIDALGGDDRITGGSAAQTIYGGSGKDVIRGGGGDDILWGDGSSTDAAFVAGKDTFIFEKTLSANGVDTIMDFGVAGHRTDGVAQAGTYVADTLDLSRIKFTGLSTESECGERDRDDDRDDDHEGHHEGRITAANVNDYVSVKDGDLYIDTDGLGEGEAQVWAHLEGVQAGDLIKLKFDDVNLQIEATSTGVLDFSALGARSNAGFLAFAVAIYDGDATRDLENPDNFLINGTSYAIEEIISLDIVDVTPKGLSSPEVLRDTVWSANGTQALGTIDASSWTVESLMTRAYRFEGGEDLNSDQVIDHQDFLLHQQANPDVEWVDFSELLGILQEQFGGKVITYFSGSAFAAGDEVEIVGVYNGQTAADTITAV